MPVLIPAGVTAKALVAMRRGVDVARHKAGAVISTVRGAASSVARPGVIHTSLGEGIVGAEQAAARRIGTRGLREAKAHLTRALRPQLLTQLPFQAPSEEQVKANPYVRKFAAAPDALLPGSNPFLSWRRHRAARAAAGAASGGLAGALPPRVVPGLDVLWSPLVRSASGPGKRPSIVRALRNAQVWLQPPVTRVARPVAPPQLVCAERPVGAQVQGGDGHSREPLATRARRAVAQLTTVTKPVDTVAPAPDVYGMRRVDDGWSSWTTPLPTPAASARAPVATVPTLARTSSGRTAAPATEGAYVPPVRSCVPAPRPVRVHDAAGCAAAPTPVSRDDAAHGGYSGSGVAHARRFTLRGNTEGGSEIPYAPRATRVRSAPALYSGGSLATRATPASFAMGGAQDGAAPSQAAHHALP